jgi:hypothetical protein
MAKLDTDYGSFKELISVARVYTVPLYQRRYSWKPKAQVAELWSDVVRLYKERVLSGTVDSTHFIGSIVVGETETRALGPGDCSIIDGQQRLLTLSLIVAAIRDTLVESVSKREEITTNYLTFPRTEQLRLELSQADAATYQAIVTGEEVRDRRSPVYQAYLYVRRELAAGVVEELDPDEAVDEDAEDSGVDAGGEAGDTLNGPEEIDVPPSVPEASQWNWEVLLQVLSQDLELVSISGVPAERAYQIFATLNHGGLRLTQVDLIRNAVFMKLPRRNQEAHRKIWQPLEENLGEKGLQRFLHAWVVRRGNNVPQKDTYASVLHELKVAGASEDEAYDLLRDLGSESRDYRVISDPSSYESMKLAKEWKVPDEMYRTLTFLASWGSVPAQPLLLETFTRWRLRRLNSTAATRLLRYVESLLVRRFIAAIPPNDLRSTLGRLVQQVRLSSDRQFGNVVIAALKEPTRRWPDDRETEDALVTRSIYRVKNVRQTFLILRRLAEELEGKECPQIDLGTSPSKYSIEHILPQTLEGTSWYQDLERWGDVDAHVTWNTRRHTLGNLTLTAYNSELSNRAFAEKKIWIRDKLRLRLSTQILESEAWSKREIEDRSRSLSAIAMKVWPYPG